MNQSQADRETAVSTFSSIIRTLLCLSPKKSSQMSASSFRICATRTAFAKIIPTYAASAWSIQCGVVLDSCAYCFHLLARVSRVQSYVPAVDSLLCALVLQIRKLAFLDERKRTTSLNES